MTPTPHTPIRLLIADDHKAMRIGLSTIFEDYDDVEVVALVEEAHSALESFEKLRPDVALLDFRMPGGNADTAAARILEIDPEAKIIVLTAYEGEEDVWRAVQAGARGYLSKSSKEELIYEAVRVVAGGETFFPEAIEKKLRVRGERPQLSKRERQVLDLLSQGMSNHMICEKLGIAEPTVKHHVSAILTKFGATDRTHAVVEAIRRGIIHLDE